MKRISYFLHFSLLCVVCRTTRSHFLDICHVKQSWISETQMAQLAQTRLILKIFFAYHQCRCMLSLKSPSFWYKYMKIMHSMSWTVEPRNSGKSGQKKFSAIKKLKSKDFVIRKWGFFRNFEVRYCEVLLWTQIGQKFKPQLSESTKIQENSTIAWISNESIEISIASKSSKINYGSKLAKESFEFS